MRTKSSEGKAGKIPDDPLPALARTPWLLVATALFGWFLMVVLPRKAGEAPVDSGRPPDLRLWYSPAEVHALFEGWGPEFLASYRRDRFRFDLAWPLAYTFFHATLWSWWTARLLPSGHPLRGPLGQGLVLAPFVLDLLENLCMFVAAGMHPDPSAAWVVVGSIATLCKWSAVGVLAMAQLAGLVVLLVRRWRGRAA